MGKNKNLFGLVLAGVTASTVHASAIEIAVSPGAALGLGASGLSIGAGANIMVAMPGLLTHSSSFSSGVGLLINADMFFKTFVSTTAPGKTGGKTGDKKDGKKDDKTSDKKAGAAKLDDKGIKGFLNNNKVEANGAVAYRIITPKLSVGGALVSYNTMPLGSMKLNFFAGPRVGFSTFSSQDALGYLKSIDATDKADSAGKFAQDNGMLEGATVKMTVKKGAEIQLYSKKPGATPAATDKQVQFKVFTKTGGTKAATKKGAVTITFAKTTTTEAMKGVPVSLSDKDITSIIKIMKAHKAKDVTKIDEAFTGDAKKAIEALTKSKVGADTASEIKALTVGANAGVSLDFLNMSGMTIGAELSYQLDVPIKVFEGAKLTAEDIANIQSAVIADKIKGAVAKINIGKQDVVLKKGAAKVYFMANSGTGTTAKPSLQSFTLGSKDDVKVPQADAADKVQITGISMPKTGKDKGKVTPTPEFPTAVTLNASPVAISIAAQDSSDQLVTMLANGKKNFDSTYTFEAVSGKKFKNTVYTKETATAIQTAYDAIASQVPMMHKINLSIKLGMSL